MNRDIISIENEHLESIATIEGEAFLKVLHWFFSYPDKEMSLNDLSRVLEISKVTAKYIVLNLVKMGFLKKEVLGKLWRISCNRANYLNVMSKVPYNLEQITASGVIGAILRKYPGARAIVLFGSYRKGDDTEKSDIDIAVEVLGNKNLEMKQFTSLKKIGYRKDVPVNLHIFSRNKIDLNLFTNIVNGIVLYGLLEARP